MDWTQTISPFSLQMRENTNHKKRVHWNYLKSVNEWYFRFCKIAVARFLFQKCDGMPLHDAWVPKTIPPKVFWKIIVLKIFKSLMNPILSIFISVHLFYPLDYLGEIVVWPHLIFFLSNTLWLLGHTSHEYSFLVLYVVFRLIQADIFHVFWCIYNFFWW